MSLVLIVDDDLDLQLLLKEALQLRGYDVLLASDGLKALEIVEESKDLSFVFLDLNMPEMRGNEVLEKIKMIRPHLIVIMLTAHSTIQDAVSCIKQGAYDFLEKPAKVDDLVSLMQRAGEAKQLLETARYSGPRVEGMIGDSPPMEQLFFLMEKLGRVKTPVLIRGESGTGKELVARAIHFNSDNKSGPFVVINCAAMPENLLESELFGHEKGAFTGATERKMGKCLQANGGTLFLDEIAEMPLLLQAKILRFLQEKSFTPVGSLREVKVDVRILAATHQALEDMIEAKEFRLDLFYRLNVMPLKLAPLRERKEDISSLLAHYIAFFNKQFNLNIQGVDPCVLDTLLQYHWPGNIRELKNVVEHAFILEESDLITLSSLPSEIKELAPVGPYKRDYLDTRVEGLDFKREKESFEREFLKQALERNQGKINQTALMANIPKKTLLRKIDFYQMKSTGKQ